MGHNSIAVFQAGSPTRNVHVTLSLVGHQIGEVVDYNKQLQMEEDEYEKERRHQRQTEGSSSFLRSPSRASRPSVTTKVVTMRDLEPVPFYQAIKQAGLLMTAINHNTEYFTSQATSSIPAALISKVPIVTSLRLLRLYPCLQDPLQAPIHHRMNDELSECASMRAVAQLSTEELEQAKKEVERCSAVMYRDSLSLFREILQSAD